MSMMLFGVAALVGGLLQGVTGFGAGVIMMMALPFLFAIPQAAAVSSLASLALSASMTWRYRQSVNVRRTLVPLVPYLVCSACAISFATKVDQELLTRIFGVFLVVLAAYNLLTMGKARTHSMPLIAQVGCVVFSGVCDGLFGIGGPLMVLFFLSRTSSQEEYLGSIQVFFTLNLIVSSTVRVANGILTVELVPFALVGAVCLMVGLLAANRLLTKLDKTMVQRITYAAIALCGATNLI